ncbi:MAG: radical SAM protein [Deltaproteobacteria bacterium]|nr:radical SAM protein [Deltaproteobacteria bacterium]
MRLTRCCNNRCLFCHDNLAQVGERFVPAGELEKAMRAGGAQGQRERLILSGGEPTLHPGFVELVELGSALGYSWIQVVTNGRMFAYRRFASRVAQAGLNEATFSIHGHTAALHDRLVGVHGAYEQALAGMDNLCSFGVVANVDVVINRLNLDALPEMIELFCHRGVGEFDLLWMVPFGRAWENRSLLGFEPIDARPILHETICRARAHGAVVWTNRLPPELLEGHEELIQDPHKLQDEVRGRQQELEACMAGEPMACRQAERCGRCFIRDFCNCVHGFQSLVDHRACEAGEVSADLLAGVQRLRMSAESFEQALAVLRTQLETEPIELVIELGSSCEGDPRDLAWPEGVQLLRVASREPDCLEKMLELDGLEMEIVLDAESAAWILRRSEDLRARPAGLIVSLRPVSSLAELDRVGVDPRRALAPLAGSGLRLLGMPACLVEGAEMLCETPALPADVLGTDRRCDLALLCEFFARCLYRVHSLRCQACTLLPGCPGLPIHYARAFGLGLLQPRLDLDLTASLA